MIKLFIKVNVFLCFMMSSFVQATLITTPLVGETDTTRGNYITYQGLDIAWASNVNSEKWYINLNEINILKAPETHTGWGFATKEQWDVLTSLTGSELLSLFTRTSDGTLIQAFEYWNTVFDGETDTRDVLASRISSQWSWNIPLGEDSDNLTDDQKIDQIDEIITIGNSAYDTFYFRKTSTVPVPEPSTLMIFVLSLIALVSTKNYSARL